MAATSVEHALASAFSQDGPPMAPGQFRRWQEPDTMLSFAELLATSSEHHRQLMVCPAAVVAFGIVERQRVLFNAGRNGLFAIHDIRVTEAVRGTGAGALLRVATAGGRVFMGDAAFETGIHGDVPARNIETLLLLTPFRAPADSFYKVMHMAEPFEANFRFFGFEGPRSTMAQQLREVSAGCAQDEGK